MPTLTEQVRAARHQSARRRRVATGLVLGAVAVLLAGRVPDGGSADRVDAGTAAAATSSASTMSPPPTGLHPGLAAAFGRARAEAARAGQRLTLTSGFRTQAEQAALLEAEVAEQGSLEEALWWVFPPERSMHVQGLAIDVGDGPAADWLREEGDRFGLCHTLSWEWWHFEWRARWEEAGECPAPAEVPADAPHR